MIGKKGKGRSIGLQHAMRRLGSVGILVVLLWLIAFALACQRQAATDTRAADERALRDADTEWSKAAGAKDLERTISYYADDASVFPPNAPIATGKQAIRTLWSQLLQSPGFAISWQPTKAEASRGGDMGYTTGTYQLTMNDPEGKPITDHGKYVGVWKKQPDGSWKVVADIFNSDQPPPPAPASPTQ